LTGILRFETVEAHSNVELPDGIFSNQLSKFVKILECLAMKDAGIFYVHLVYIFTAIWYILWLSGIFFPFWYVVARKNLATLRSGQRETGLTNRACQDVRKQADRAAVTFPANADFIALVAEVGG
jgi:hypothetical protein